jgi:hypothetical protein
MKEKIIETYNKINVKYLKETIYNIPKERFMLKSELMYELGSGFSVICDNSNNPQDIVIQNIIVATVIYSENGSNQSMNLLFGTRMNFNKCKS